ncbi:MAG: ATP synthase F1 subunit gamma [Acidobacteria bacterium SCN 69-37]|nr:MAG: ATP synthase F1 subunit gamma [Acidobacteria bacterium SCN 69-37]
MPSLIDMRRRIRAVKSTQQITKAMKMVAASKLRRAQERVIATRPFAGQARQVLASIASRVDPAAHPLLARRAGTETGATLLIAISADRGLCGSFNTNVIKTVGSVLRENTERPISLGLVGRKSRDFLGRRGVPVRFDYVNLPKVITYAEAEAIANPAVSDFIEGKVDSVHLIYNEFKSVIAQKVVVEQLLPFVPEPVAEGQGPRTAEYLFEPSPERILDVLLQRLVVAQVLRALLESNAAFFAAQMTAMDAATRNSREMMDSLTLYMNKLRQAAITREIIEVVSGSQVS